MSEAIKPTLLPCPFCGGTPSHGKAMDEDIWSHNTVPWRRVRCAECEIGTDYVCEGYDPSEVEAWNRRSDPLVERVKELEKTLLNLDDYVCNSLSSDYPTGVDVNAAPFLNARTALSKSLPNTVAEVQ